MKFKLPLSSENEHHLVWVGFVVKILLEQAPQGIGAAKPVRMPSTLTQIHPILPKSNQNLDLEPLNVDLMSDLVNPCAIRAAGGQQ